MIGFNQHTKPKLLPKCLMLIVVVGILVIFLSQETLSAFSQSSQFLEQVNTFAHINLLQSTTTPVQFTVSTVQATISRPPDTMGVIGPNQYVSALNSGVRSFSVTGAYDGQLGETLQSFFQSVRSRNRVIDPQVRFDRGTSRWFIIATTDTAGGGCDGCRVVIAISNAASATSPKHTAWKFYSFPAKGPGHPNDFYTLDQPWLSVDTDNVYVAGLGVCGIVGELRPCTYDVYVIKKDDLLEGRLSWVAFRNFTGASTSVNERNIPRTVDIYGNVRLANRVVALNRESNQIIIRKVSFNLAENPISLDIEGAISIPAYVDPPTFGIPQPSGAFIDSTWLAANDGRLVGAVLRNTIYIRGMQY